MRMIFRVCGERGVVRLWPFLCRVGASAAGWLLSPTTPCCPPSQDAMVHLMQWWAKGATPSLGLWALWVDS